MTQKTSSSPDYTILSEANQLITGDRAVEYGDARESFVRIAQLWSTVLGQRVTPLEVIRCMIALKVSRAADGYHRDSYVDIAGYAALAELFAND